MKKNLPLLLLFLVIIAIISWFSILINRSYLPLLNSHGVIGIGERDLIVTAMGIMLSVAIPVVLLTYFVAWKYRASSTKSRYAPDWTGNKKVKILYWGF